MTHPGVRGRSLYVSLYCAPCNSPHSPLLMFGKQAFDSWLHVLLGAFCFAALFALVGVLAGRVTGGVGGSGRIIGLGIAAFLSYVGAAVLVRLDPSP